MADDLVRDAIKQLQKDDEEARSLTSAALDDLRTHGGDQWPAKERARREKLNLPVLTNNLLLKYVGQVYGTRLLNMTEAKIVPERGGTDEEAEIRMGALRHAWRCSTGRLAVGNAFYNMLVCGVGNFRLSVNETKYDVFDKDISFDPIYNALSVVWDRASREPTGKDAERVFEIISMGEDEFEEQFPGAQQSDVMTTGFLDRVTRKIFTPEQERRIRIAAWWRMKERDAEVALLKDYSVMDITDLPPEQWLPLAKMGDDGQPITRETKRPICEYRLISGTEVLEGPVELPISRVPVFRMTGNDSNIGEDYMRWGMVRFLKDAQMLNNYWDSSIARVLQLASLPQPYVASDEAISGREDQWREWWSNDEGLLTYRAGTPQPNLAQVQQIHPALFTERERTAQYMSDISNMGAAAFGQEGNEVSGVAIQARQQIAELGAVPYNWHADLALQEAGEVFNELFPHVYDANRMIAITGPENQETMQEINIISDPRSRITSAKYRVNVTTGPSFATRREEQRQTLMTALNHAPDVTGLALDKIFETFDTPEARIIAKRIRAGLPPGVVQPEEMTEEEQQAAAQRQQAQQQAQQFEQAMAEAKLKRELAMAAQAEALARQATAQSMRTIADLGLSEERVSAELDKLRAEASETNARAAKVLSEIGVQAKKADVNEFEAVSKAAEAAVKQQETKGDEA